MTAQAALSPRALQAGVLAVAVALGVLAGVNPPLAVVTTLGLAFMAMAMANLTAGLCLFAVLTFVDEVLPYEATGPFSFPKLMGLLLVLSWIAVVTVGEEERRAKVFPHPGFLYVLVLFIGWAAISALWAEETRPVLEAVYRWVPNAMLFLIVYSAIRTRDQAMWLIGAFVAGALISASYGLLVPTDPGAQDRLSGGAGNANETAAALVAAAALAAALAVALRDKPVLRLAATIGIPFLAYGVFLTLSRGGLVALGAALLAAIAVAGRWRAQAVALAAAAAVGGLLYFAAVAPPEARERVTEVGGGTGRVDLWTIAWRMVEDKPLTGVGASNYRVSSVHYLLEPGAIIRDDFIVDVPKVAHNTYLQVLAELGIVGALLFLGVVGFAVVSTVRAIRCSKRAGDGQMEVVSRATFVAMIGMLAAAFFGSRQFSKQLWLLLSFGPALLAIARARLETARASPAALSGSGQARRA